MADVSQGFEIITGTLTTLGVHAKDLSLFDASRGLPIQRPVTRSVLQTDEGRALVVEAAGIWYEGQRISGILNGINREGGRLVLFPVGLAEVFNLDFAVARAHDERLYYATRLLQSRYAAETASIAQRRAE